jgi:hypothetical protein
VVVIDPAFRAGPSRHAGDEEAVIDAAGEVLACETVGA